MLLPYSKIPKKKSNFLEKKIKYRNREKAQSAKWNPFVKFAIRIFSMCLFIIEIFPGVFICWWAKNILWCPNRKGLLKWAHCTVYNNHLLSLSRHNQGPLSNVDNHKTSPFQRTSLLISLIYFLNLRKLFSKNIENLAI